MRIRYTNCPNCGAPIDTDKCPYCGTRFVDIADLKTGEPIWLTFEYLGKTFGVRVSLSTINVRVTQEEPDYFYRDNQVAHTISINETIDINLEGQIAPRNNDGVRLIVAEPDVDIRKAIDYKYPFDERRNNDAQVQESSPER